MLAESPPPKRKTTKQRAQKGNLELSTRPLVHHPEGGRVLLLRRDPATQPRLSRCSIAETVAATRQGPPGNALAYVKDLPDTAIAV
jgi:hypothetical protein